MLLRSKRYYHPRSPPPPPIQDLSCNVCYNKFPGDLPYYAGCQTCKQRYNRNDIMCQFCFQEWIMGLDEDNPGYRLENDCSFCGTIIDGSEIKRLLTPTQYARYEQQITKMCINRMQDVIHCPVPNCTGVFLKLQKNDKCRVVVCDGCNTELCGKCGELYNSSHKRMSCAQYQGWKRKRDDETIMMNEYINTDTTIVHECPGCNCIIEKTFGCRQMECKNCEVKFCWNCNKVTCVCA